MSLGPNRAAVLAALAERARRNAEFVEQYREDPGPGAGFGGGGSVKLILVRLTGNSALKSVNSNVGGGSSVSVDIMWTYSAIQIEAFNPTTQAMVDMTDGLEFSATGADDKPKLYNIAEWGHTASYVWGIRINSTNYPIGNRPRPIGGGDTSNTHKYDRPVMVWEFQDHNGDLLYVMDEMGTHDGACS
jgi:hypothetical protein